MFPVVKNNTHAERIAVGDLVPVDRAKVHSLDVEEEFHRQEPIEVKRDVLVMEEAFKVEAH